MVTSFIILAERVLILSLAARAVHARIASGVRFRLAHKSFYRFGILSCLATSHKQILKTPSAWRHRAFWVSRQHGHRLGLILFIVCLLYVGESPGESQSVSEANNTGLQTQQCPIGQVAGNPCSGRFNTERTATWTSARAAKKKTSALIERPIQSPREDKRGNNAKSFANTSLSYFSFHVYLWIQDKYNSTRFKQCEWQRKIFQGY